MNLPAPSEPLAERAHIAHSPRAIPAVRIPTVPEAVRVMLFALGYIVLAIGAVVGVAYLFRLQGSTFGLVTSVGIEANLAALFAVWFHLVKKRRYRWADLGLTAPSWRILHILWQAPVLLVVSVVFAGLALQLFFGDDPPSSSSSAATAALGMPAVFMVLAWFVVGVLTPFVEEIVFRGVLFRALNQRMPAIWAVILGGIIFGAAHVAPPALPYVTAVGIGLCLVTLFHRNIWASILIHAFNNSMVFLLIVAGVKSAT